MDDELLRKELLIGLQCSHEEEDWVVPLNLALQDVTAEQALRRPAPDAMGIWDIVLHLANWHENMVERIKTGEPSRPAQGAWPPPPSEPSEPAWAAAKERLFRSLADLKATLETATMDNILGSHYGLGDLLCRFIHNGYHIGQIVKIREILGPPLPNID